MTRRQPLLYLLFLLLGLSLNVHASAGGGGGYSEGQPNYVALDPAIVVNLTAGKRIRFMQVKAQAMTRSVKMAETIEANKPAIRHALLMLLTRQDATTMSDVSKREQVRQEALVEVRQILYQLTQIGEPPREGEGEEKKKKADEGNGEHTAPVRIEDLYFTDFIIQ